MARGNKYYKLEDYLSRSSETVLKLSFSEIEAILGFGTLGCVPTYDRYYVRSVKKNNVSKGLYNKESVCCVAGFYCDNFDIFERLRHELSKCGIEYPPMKLMDMCFWQDAYIDDLKRR